MNFDEEIKKINHLAQSDLRNIHKNIDDDEHRKTDLIIQELSNISNLLTDLNNRLSILENK